MLLSTALDLFLLGREMETGIKEKTIGVTRKKKKMKNRKNRTKSSSRLLLSSEPEYAHEETKERKEAQGHKEGVGSSRVLIGENE